MKIKDRQKSRMTFRKKRKNFCIKRHQNQDHTIVKKKLDFKEKKNCIIMMMFSSANFKSWYFIMFVHNTFSRKYIDSSELVLMSLRFYHLFFRIFSSLPCYTLKSNFLKLFSLSLFLRMLHFHHQTFFSVHSFIFYVQSR